MKIDKIAAVGATAIVGIMFLLLAISTAIAFVFLFVWKHFGTLGVILASVLFVALLWVILYKASKDLE